MNYVNFEAFFLGPKGENEEFYKSLLVSALSDHVQWRKAFHHDDLEKFITEEDKKKKNFIKSQEKISNTIYALRELLKKNQPFFSPRYIGHMNWEVMMAPIIAFFNASLFNPNNVAKAGSTGTSQLELEVGKDFLNLFGFDENKGWGHICTGGTVANMEALWIARNMKVIPLVLKKILKHLKKEKEIDEKKLKRKEIEELVKSHKDFLLKSYNPYEILDLKDSILKYLSNLTKNERYIEDLFDRYNMQEQGYTWDDGKVDVGVVYLPETKHYSLKKAMDLLGLGRKNVCYIPVDEHFRMDMEKLEKSIMKQKRPILAVVGIVGSTEESSVDAVDKIVKIRKKLEAEQEKSFHIHVDAAYGGYVRTLFLNENNHFMSKDELESRLKELKIIGDKKERNYVSWPHPETFKAFKAFPKVDTITVDPHKLGYVLYPAGGIALSDKRMRNAIQTFAPYVFEKPSKNVADTLIGSYILEGSKPGAAAAAVWTAHQIMPLNITGYGKLIGETIDGAQALYYGLNNLNEIKVNDKISIRVHPVAKPDINIVNYAFNFCGNRDLEKMNRLTDFIANEVFSSETNETQVMLEKSFIVSSTKFTQEEYGNSPKVFIRKADIDDKEWDSVKTVSVIRSVIMSPYLTTDYVDVNYVNKYINVIKKEIKNNKSKILKIHGKDNSSK